MKKPVNIKKTSAKGVNQKLKILIAVANYRPIHPRTQASIDKLLSCKEFDWSMETCNYASIAHCRSTLSREVEKYDYILFIDTDIVFTLDDFIKLLQQKKPIICGAYKHANEDWYVAGTDDVDEHISTKVKTGVILVTWVGLGFTLIESSVFEKMEQPYFEMPKGDVVQIVPEWEDYNFCRKHKGKVFVHCDTSVIHLPREKGVYMSDAMWADVLVAVIKLPLPYEKSSELVNTLKNYLK